MLVKVTKPEEIQEIEEYIGDNFKATPYLYANVVRYGLGTENVFTWIDRNDDGGIDGIYLLYYDCIHFYTNDIDGYPVERLIDFVRKTDHKVVMLQGGIGDRVNDEFADYYSERNHVIDMDKCGLEQKEFLSQVAGREDIEQIADLLIADPEYENVYDRQVLIDQMLDRYDGGFSRYFAVKMDGKVVATCSTYGEVPKLALIGGVIVHPDYRRRGLAGDVENFASQILAKENIPHVGFVNFNNTASLALHEKLGAFSIAILAKFVKK